MAPITIEIASLKESESCGVLSKNLTHNTSREPLRLGGATSEIYSGAPIASNDVSFWYIEGRVCAAAYLAYQHRYLRRIYQRPENHSCEKPFE